MTLREDVRRHLDRLNLADAWFNDPQSRWSLTLLSQWIDTTEAAMVDAGIDEPQRRQVLDRVLYGSMPSRAELELRERLTATLIDQHRRAPGGGMPGGGTTVAAGTNGAGGSGAMVFDPQSQTWLGGGGGVPGGGSNVVTGRGCSESEPSPPDHGTIILTDESG